MLRRLRRLKWLTVLAALLFVVLLDAVRLRIYPYLPSWPARLLLGGMILAAAGLSLMRVFQIIEEMQERLARQNRELLASQEAARELHERLRQLAVAEERLRIAHEMHDGLAQVLAYVNTKAQAVREFLRAGRNDDAVRHLDQLAAAAREVYGDVRESIIGLRNAAVPGRPLADALRHYAASWESQHGIPCQVEADPEARLSEVRLSDNVELQIQRIVQEALTNVRKHARAKQVEISLARTAGGLAVTVRDDGAGFNPERLGRAELPRFGLATLRERAESIGGTLHLDSAPGRGTRVTVEIPRPDERSG